MLLLNAAFFSATIILLGTTPTKAQQPRVPFRIVHLGDSFSAGNGARNADGDEDFHSVSKCYRSQSNWGSQFANSLADVFAVTYINRACSGGVVDDILNERELDSVTDIFGGCPEADFPDEEIIRATGLVTCTRYLRPQIEAIDTSVDLVLMTGGGNDAGFAVIIKQCFALGFRDVEECANAINFANTVLDTLGDELITTFANIHSRLKPEARVVLVSYPHLLLDVPYVLEDGGVQYDAGTAIRDLNNRADEVQQAAVGAANAAAGKDYIVYFKRTKELFDTHEPDPSVSAKNPNRWINEFFEGSMPEYYHPNALGHENWGSALSIFETFGAVGGNFKSAANIDLVFIVDTTGSMGDEIKAVRDNLSDLVSQLASTTASYRVAVVSYRDFKERTGSASDYPSRVDQTFTSSLDAIQTAVDSLMASGGGDEPETVFSGIKAAIDLPWRPGVTKIAVVIGDAPPLISSGAEPISGLTASQIVAESIAIDPVQVIAVNVGSLVDNALQSIVESTGGTVLGGAGNLIDTLSNIIDVASKQPFAWFGFAIAGKIGIPIVFDAQGSFDPQGLPILLYEWDFDGDGGFDLETTTATATWTYDAAFDGFVILRVTSEGGTALASARTVINEAGSVSQGDEEPCDLDENGFSIIVGDNSTFLNCNPTNLPTTDKPGVREIGGTISIETAVANVKAAVSGLSPPAFGKKGKTIAKQVDANNYAGACDSLNGLVSLTNAQTKKKINKGKKIAKQVDAKHTNAQTKKKITVEQADAILAAVDVLSGLLGCKE